MGQYDGFEFEDENGAQGNESGSDLRKARDAAAKKAKDLEAQLAKLTEQLTERNLKDVLQEKSLDLRLVRFMKADGIDGSDAAKVDAWLSENGDLVGYKPDTSEAQNVPDARAEEFARMQGLQANALPAGKDSEAYAALNSAEGIDAMNAALRQATKFG